MTLRTLGRTLGVGVCAALIFVLAACGGGGGGGSNTNGNTQQIPPLVIATTSLPSGITGVAYQQTLSASGGTLPYTWSQNGLLPSGLMLNASTGGIVGTVSGAVFGQVLFTVTDSSSPHLSTSQSIPMTFNWQLSFSTTSLPAAHINAPYDAVIALSTNADPSSWTMLSGTLPPGLQLSNPAAQQIEIAGTTTQTGTFPLTMQVQDTSTPPQIAKQDFVLTVDNALTILTQRLGAAIINSNYSATLSAVNGTPPYQWSAVGLPALLTIGPTNGTIAGVPTVYGVFQPTITVTDAAGHSASQLEGLSVIGALTVPNTGNLSAVVNKLFYDSLVAFGGSPPYSWLVASGSLPPGMTLDGAHGIVSGTPTQLGNYPVTFQVTDTGPPQQTTQWATTIAVVPPQLYITGVLPPKLPLGVPVQWSAGAQGGTPPYHWNPATGALPPGLSFDPNTGDLTGTPTTVGQYTFVLSATDSGSPPQTANSSFTANVTTPLGRNDTIAHATPLGDGSWQASMSPYADPPDNPSPSPDTDYYKIIGSAGSTVKIWTIAKTYNPSNPLDTVLEIVDANGVRFSSCRQPGDTSNNFNSACLNDDLVPGVSQDSELEIQVPGAANTQTTMYAHVLDWRGDARPDMVYSLNVSGSVPPLMVTAPAYTTYGSGYTATAACPIGLTCTAQFNSSGGSGTISWTVDSGSVPPGMTLSQTGTLSGTPTTNGQYLFVARATDSSTPAQSVTVNYTLTIESPPKLTTTSLPDGYSGQPYSQSLSVSGGTPPYTWGFSAYWDGSLNFNTSTGNISGIPTFTNTYDLYVSVNDSLGLGDSGHVSLTIRPGPFSFAGGAFPSGNVGVVYVDYGPPPKGGTTPYQFAVVSGSVPPGLTFYSNGSMTGTPTTAGTYTLLVQATDSSIPPQTATATYTITINP